MLQDDLKGWIRNITTSISEHEEIAKWGQPQPTTSSTDEGTRRDGSKAEKSEKGERSDRGDKAEKGERSERSEKGGRTDKRSSTSGKRK